MVVNKAGGGAIPGRVDVVRARPDGYTVLFGWGSGEDLVVPHQRKLPYDVFNDFEVGPRLSIHSVIMTVPASSPYKTVAEFVTWAKTKEYVTASVSTKGASVDITMQMFAKAAGFKLTSIPGSGSATPSTRSWAAMSTVAASCPPTSCPTSRRTGSGSWQWRWISATRPCPRCRPSASSATTW